MQGNSKPFIIVVPDLYKMHSLVFKYPAGTIYYVNDRNKCYISCEDGSFAFFNSVATTSVEENSYPFYPDEDTYRI